MLGLLRRRRRPPAADGALTIHAAAVELQLLAASLEAVNRDLRRAERGHRDGWGAELARSTAERIRHVETLVSGLRLRVAAAPYVGASGASVIEHQGEIYLVGSPITHEERAGRALIGADPPDGRWYVVSSDFKSGNLVARPFIDDTRAGASAHVTCPTCRGTGGGQYNDCPTCDGNGVV